MKNILLFIAFNFLITNFIFAQDKIITNQHKQEIHSLIDAYAQAREKKDTILLDRILTTDVDQLVSSGTWRNDKNESMKGMLKSSTSKPGSRRITIEKIIEIFISISTPEV